MQRTFTYSDAKSHKFWNVECVGTDVLVHYGRLGTDGQKQTKSFPTEEAAIKQMEKLIKEKTGKGYVETTAGSEPERSTQELLEAAILAHPEDRAAHAALADYLLENGDPWGELITVQLALEDESLTSKERDKLRKQEEALFAEYRTTWLDTLAEFEQGNEYERAKFTFVRGILAKVEFPYLRVTQARNFVATPVTRMVRELYIGDCAYEEPGREYEEGPDTDSAEEGAASLFVMASWKHLTNIRKFRLGDGDYTLPSMGEPTEDYYNCRTPGEYADAFVRQMPNIESLELLCRNPATSQIFARKMPNLKVLLVYHSRNYATDKLAANDSLGQLTHLLFHPKALDFDDEPYLQVKNYRHLANSKNLKSLKHLRLRLSNAGDEGVKVLVNSDLMNQLETLDLKHGKVTDAGAALLATCLGCKNMLHLELSYNCLTNEGQELLRNSGIQFSALEQWEYDPDADDEDEEYLYAGDGE